MSRTVDFHLRMSEDELAELEKISHECGMTKSQYLRAGIGEKRTLPKVPDELIDLMKELNRVGINLNQLVVVCRSSGYREDQVLETIDQLSKVGFELRRAIYGIRQKGDKYGSN